VINLPVPPFFKSPQFIQIVIALLTTVVEILTPKEKK
jgi:hypothetical protein